MHILKINNYHRIIGGSDSVYFNTKELLVEAGHNVYNFSTSNEGNYGSNEEQYFVPTLDTNSHKPQNLVRYIYNYQAKKSLNKLLRNLPSIDIAHLHIYYGQLTTSILKELKSSNIPVIQTLHEYKLICPAYTMSRENKPCDICVKGNPINAVRHKCKENSLVKSLAIYLEYTISRLLGDVRLIDKFICVSDFQLKLMSDAGIPKDKLIRVHNFVDTSVYNPIRYKLNEGYLLFLGRIELLKGINTLIEAVKMTGQRLIIAGTGVWESNMRDSIRGYDNIEYRGFVSGDNLNDLLEHAMAVVVPSEWYENCPMSVLEAKAKGVPVIGARIGGIPELIQDQIDGFLFDSGNLDDLIRVLVNFNSYDYKELCLKARQDILTRFSKEKHIKDLENIYKSVIN